MVREHRNFLVSFHPLCSTAHGREAIRNFGLPPFSDGSCRREPDLQCAFPSISSLCRAGNFAPHLRKGDRVFYMTVKGKYGHRRGWALVAALHVLRVHPSHQDAANWYESVGLSIPSNCMVAGNDCLPVERTTGLPAEGPGMQQAWNQNGTPPADLEQWNAHYQVRAIAYPSFVVTLPLALRLNDPPIFHRDALSGVFDAKRVPVTQSHKKLTKEEFDRLLALIQSH